MLQHAAYWDHFLEWVREIQSPWDPADSDEYRKARATSWFTHARQCSRDLLALKPTMQSWVPYYPLGSPISHAILSHGKSYSWAIHRDGRRTHVNLSAPW